MEDLFYYILLLGDAYQKNWDEKPKSGGFCPGLAMYIYIYIYTQRVIIYIYVYGQPFPIWFCTWKWWIDPQVVTWENDDNIITII